MTRVLVVGAGPAGIAAAVTLAEAGVETVVADEGWLPGGRIFQQPPDGARGRPDRYGTEAAKARRLHEDAAALAPRIDYRPSTTIWAVGEGMAYALRDGAAEEIAHDGLILCPGAIDRVAPVPGWTLGGVFTLGGAQIALKAHDCLVGRRVAFIGNGPLLYLVAHQYAGAGAEIAALLDFSRPVAALKALPRFVRRPGLLLKGLRLVRSAATAAGQRARMPTAVRILGEGRAEAVSWRSGGRSHRADCDAVAIGFGLRSELQLAEMAGCGIDRDAATGEFAVRCDAEGRTGVPGVYVAGDGAAIGGADMAALQGRRAALAWLRDHGRPTGAGAGSGRRFAAFARGVAEAFPYPDALVRALPGDAVVCACERVTRAAIEEAAGRDGATELNRLKALTRLGMGPCQGRYCERAAAVLLGAGGAGRLRAQAPIKPIAVSLEKAP